MKLLPLVCILASPLFAADSHSAATRKLADVETYIATNQLRASRYSRGDAAPQDDVSRAIEAQRKAAKARKAADSAAEAISDAGGGSGSSIDHSIRLRNQAHEAQVKAEREMHNLRLNVIAAKNREEAENAQRQAALAEAALTPEQRAARAKAASEKLQKSYAAAFEFNRQKALQGEAYAMRRLGEFYLLGRGCEANTNEAKNWLGKAAQAGDTEAQKLLVTLP